MRACWYRAFMEFAPSRALNRPSDLLAVCAGLRALQRQACITGASAIFQPGEPTSQLSGCAQLPGPDRVSCARGVATSDLLGQPLAAGVRLTKGCDRFRVERAGCLEWIAKALNVVTDGRFAAAGCHALAATDRGPCQEGAASWQGPLETFS